MGIKTLGTVIGHVSSATTLNAYTHIVDAMWHSTSDKSDQGTGVETYAPFSNRKSYGILAKAVRYTRPRLFPEFPVTEISSCNLWNTA